MSKIATGHDTYEIRIESGAEIYVARIPCDFSCGYVRGRIGERIMRRRMGVFVPEFANDRRMGVFFYLNTFWIIPFVIVRQII